MNSKEDEVILESSMPWVLGFAVGVMGLVGLFVAAGAEHPLAYWGGLAFFAFAVGLVIRQVKRAFDRVGPFGP